ncbi:ECF-type sigma factor, partial [Patulibacter medicamentivorans]|uniref:ECF-type sigma factor n=1 Tax=Patulibacter medicamentivorans TaxID=1097667 RepID=UPI00111038D9
MSAYIEHTMERATGGPSSRGSAAGVRGGARRRADRVLQQSYESLRSSTLRTLDVKLRRVGLILDRADQDAAYNFAWHGLYQRMLAGEEIDNLGGFLAQAAYFRAIDEARRLRLDRRADDCEVADLAAAAADLDQQLDDAQMLRSFAEGLRVRLRPREREAATLCYLHGYSRAEAADVLGLTPRRMGKVMDRVSKQVGSLVDDLREGDWCREQRSLITAYAFDALDRDGERHAIATSHLADCSACRALVRRLRAASAVVPPLALPWAVVGGAPTAAPEAVGEHLGSLLVPDRWSSRWTGAAANVAGAAPSLAALAPVVALAGAVGVSAAVR